MASGRGSKHKLGLVIESTFGTTPATPTLLEIPLNTFTPNVNQTMIQSEQIRTHPFVDRVLQGAQTPDISLTAELQKNNHDSLLQLMCGQAWASNANKIVDVLLSASLESQHTDLTLYDVYTGSCVKQAQFNFPAAADAKVTTQFDLMCKAAVLDNSATITGETFTAATNVDPFVFSEAGLTLGGVTKPVTNATLTVTRQIDPLYLLGALQPDEYIPSKVEVSGTVTIPLRSNAESTILNAFTTSALVISCTHPSSGGSFVFTIPNCKLGKGQRPVQNRGVILQTYDFMGFYDSVSASVMTLART